MSGYTPRPEDLEEPAMPAEWRDVAWKIRLGHLDHLIHRSGVPRRILGL